MIGRQVVDILSESACHIRIVSLDRIKINAGIEHIYADLSDFSLCKELTKGMDYVFHLAGIGASVKTAAKKIASHFVPMLMVNTNLLEACRLNKVAKVTYVSSIGAYAEAEILRESADKLDSMPMDFAGWAKRMAEAQIYAYKAEFGLDNFSIVRPANVYGPGDNFGSDSCLVIPSLLYRIYRKDNPVSVWGDGSAIRDFVYSRDVAEGIILAMYYGTQGGFVNLGGGRGYTIKELVDTLHSFLDFKHVFDSNMPTGIKKRVMDISLAGKLIKYHPVTFLAEGLRKTWEWFIEHPDEYRLKANYFSTEENAQYE